MARLGDGLLVYWERGHVHTMIRYAEALTFCLHLSIRIRTPTRISPETLLNLNIREVSVGLSVMLSTCSKL